MSTEEIKQLTDLIRNMKDGIENKIIASQSSIETRIDDLTTTINTEVRELKSSFDELKTSLGGDIDTLKQHMNEHKQRLDNNEDDINRLKLSADLRLNGIPFNQGENLIELFRVIATAIGYDTSISNNMPLMKRMPVRNKITGTMIESSIITLHFSSVQHKQHFYSLYLSKMPLKSDEIGLAKEYKIIIGECLTGVNARIFKYAQDLKKDEKIAQLFTVDGLVKVKFVKGPNQRAHVIRNTMQLDFLVKQHEQQKSYTTENMIIDTPPSDQITGNSARDTSIELINSAKHVDSQQPSQQRQHSLQQQHHQQQNTYIANGDVHTNVQQQQQLQQQQHQQQQLQLQQINYQQHLNNNNIAHSSGIS